MSGVIIFGDDEYVIEPVDPNQPLSVTNKTSGGTHIIYRTTDHEDHEDMIDDLMKKIDLTNDAEFLRLFDNSGLRVKRTSHLLPTDQVYYVKIMLVADSSLQDFHGSSTVMYMAKLINFVNMIYAHDTLGLNIKFVIVSVKLLNYCTSRKIICSSAADSLTNANKWAASQNTADDDDPNHFDMSFFLTRNNDGMVGVDGFATIGATCRPSSSAVLVRDVENLRDSFVAAHEAGHMLGLSHVHYYQSCGDDVDSPAIMSRISWSKFHNYFWSSCSRETLYFQLRTGRLDCLEDSPTMTNEEYTYPGLHTTLDEQCRFDYESAATACQVRGSDPCASLYCQRTPKTLWCGTGSTLRPIRPMEGTMCAENKWCVQGVCRERQNGQSNDSIYEWHEGDWSPCSLTCGGIGVKSRIITCRELRYDSSGRLGVVSDQVDESLCHPDLKPTREAECPTEACSAN